MSDTKATETADAPNNAADRVVLIPIDESPNSARAFQWYATDLHKTGDLVVFVHVVEPAYTTPAIGLAMEAVPMAVDDLTRVMEEDIRKGKTLGKSFMKQAKVLSINSKAFIHVDNKPGGAILKSAEDHSANIIVIGNRGMGKLKRTFLGSVSDHVLHHSHLPVVVVPPPADAHH